MQVAWKHEHTLGYELIDEGHRMVVGIINRLNGREAGRDEVAALLNMVEGQLGRQFHHEEALMMVSRSKWLEEHCREHRRMLDTLARLRQNFNEGERIDGLLLINLAAFLHSHLRGSDIDEFGAEPIHWAA